LNAQVDGILNATDLNGVDPVAFSNDVVLLDVDAEIEAKKNFETLKVNLLTAPEIICKSVHPDVIRTAAEAVKLDHNNEMVTGPVHFEDLVVKGDVELSTLNGRSFPDGFLMLDGDQDLPSSLVADRVSVLGDIQLLKGARINGLDLDAEIANTWMVIYFIILVKLLFFNNSNLFMFRLTEMKKSTRPKRSRVQ